MKQSTGPLQSPLLSFARDLAEFVLFSISKQEVVQASNLSRVKFCYLEVDQHVLIERLHYVQGASGVPWVGEHVGNNLRINKGCRVLRNPQQ